MHIGGAGAFDSLILAGILAVLLAELVGETRERLQGGPKSEGATGRFNSSPKRAGASSQAFGREGETGSSKS